VESPDDSENAVNHKFGAVDPMQSDQLLTEKKWCLARPAFRGLAMG
jgi:hypothetical protein